MAITKASSSAVAPAAKGDLVVGNATNDSGVLAVGTANQVLTVDSSTATGLKWAAAAGGGKVLQVVSATTTTSTTITTTTYTDTTLTASITPSSATSKILVLVTQMWYFNRTGIVIYPKGQIVRGASSIYENTFLGGFGVPNATGLIEAFGVWSPSYLDSPSTTSSTTYKTQMARQGLATGDLIANFGSVAASIILLEIGA